MSEQQEKKSPRFEKECAEQERLDSEAWKGRLREYALRKSLAVVDVDEIFGWRLKDYGYVITKDCIKIYYEDDIVFRETGDEEKKLFNGERYVLNEARNAATLELPCTPKELVEWWEKNSEWIDLDSVFIKAIGEQNPESQSVNWESDGPKRISDVAGECANDDELLKAFVSIIEDTRYKNKGGKKPNLWGDKTTNQPIICPDCGTVPALMLAHRCLFELLPKIGGLRVFDLDGRLIPKDDIKSIEGVGLVYKKDLKKCFEKQSFPIPAFWFSGENPEEIAEPSNLSTEETKQHENSAIIEIVEPQNKDDWFFAIHDCIRELENENGRTPNESLLWISLRKTPPQGYGITSGVDRGKECITLDDKSIDREAFKKRYKRLYPS